MAARLGDLDGRSEVFVVIGSPGWARTSDILINSQALYRLSYRGVTPCTRELETWLKYIKRRAGRSTGADETAELRSTGVIRT